MKLKSIYISKYKCFSDFTLDFLENENNLYAISSRNGGGKSTLLQLLFISLTTSFNTNKSIYLKEAFNPFVSNKELSDDPILKISLLHNNEEYFIEYFIKDISSFSESEFDFNVLSELDGLNEFDVYSEKFYEKNYKINTSKLNNKLYNTLHYLKTANLNFLFKINNSLFFLKTNLDDYLKKQLESMVFLNSPEHQMYLFASKKDNHSLFISDLEHKFKTLKKSNYINEIKEKIPGFYVYDFLSNDLIINTFTKFFNLDSQEKLITGDYGDHFTNFQKEFDSVLDNKKFIYKDYPFKTIFQYNNSNSDLLTLNDLSHGELRKLSLFFWFKSIIPSDSIIFLDEIDIGLHPEWQIGIVNEICNWCNSQIIVASHSPYILNHINHKNIIILERINSHINPKLLKTPPLNRDLNSVSELIMETSSSVKELNNLKFKYRTLFEENRDNNKEELEELERQILEYEGRDSNFFQEIQFLKEFSL